MNKYRLLSKKGEGAFSEVFKAQSIKTGKQVAIKCMKNYFESIEKVMGSLEIQALRRLSPHPNIIKLLEVLYDEPTGRVGIVFELMDYNMYESIKERKHPLPEAKVRNYMYQAMKAIDHMHRNAIFHRDIKPENMLVTDDILKLADLGSCRGIYSRQPYTEYISTRWYRAPECLLTDGYYDYKMDIWGAGCVMFEIISQSALFPGEDELDQINKICNVMGTPPQLLLDRFQRYASHMVLQFPPKEGTGIKQLIPHASPECIDIIRKALECDMGVELMLTYDPTERISARKVLRHPFFKPLRDQEKREQKVTALSTMRPRFPKGMPPEFSGHLPARNMDETTTSDQNNLSDYSIPSQRTKKPGRVDIKNKTNAFERQESLLPGIKNSSLAPGDASARHNGSMIGSQEGSEGEPPAQQAPLPPIKPGAGHTKPAAGHKGGPMKHAPAHEKSSSLKGELSQLSLVGKAARKGSNEDRAKVFRAPRVAGKKKKW